MRSLVAPHVAQLVPYVPGKPIEETEREYGVTNIVKLASNENCLGPSPRAMQAVTAALGHVHLYPDASGNHLRERLVRHHARHGVTSAQIVLGNGTNEIITLLTRAFLHGDEALLNAWPSFVCYRISARSGGTPEITVPLRADLSYDLERLADAALKDTRAKLVFLANPNNPTGRAFPAADLDAFLARLPTDIVVVLDEAYAEYVTDQSYPDGLAWVMKRPRTVVLRTFSKVYGLASLRVGYAVCDPEIADVLNRMRDAFNTTSLGQVAALAALDDVEHTERSVAHNARELPVVASALEQRGLLVTPSQGNFVLATLPKAGPFPSVPELNVEMLKRGVIIRPVGNYGLQDSIRVSVGTVAENMKLLGALDDLLRARGVRA